MGNINRKPDVSSIVHYNVQKIMEALKMQKIRFDQDIIPLSEVRSEMTTYIKQVHETKRPLVITKRGKSAAVLLSVQEFEAMQETIDLFSDIQSSLKQLENGKGIEHSEAKKMLLNRLLRNG